MIIAQKAGSDTQVSVILPVYNESESLPELHERLVAVLEACCSEHEVIYVDDGSTDGGVPLEPSTSVRILIHHTNRGQSAALQTGIQAARYPLIITLDSDGQNPPECIPQMVETLRSAHYDLICGWRVDRHDTASKRLTSRGAYLLRRILLHDTVHDSGCTLKVMTRDCAQSLELHGELHRFMPALARAAGYRVGEMPVEHAQRLYGESKYTAKRMRRGFVDMCMVTYMVRYRDRPMHLLGPIGILLLMSGIGALCYALVQKLGYGIDLSETILVQAGSMLILFGVVMLLFGIVLEMLAGITRRPTPYTEST